MMSEENNEKNLDFVVNPLSDEELEDVSGGNAPEACSSGSCSNGSVQANDDTSTE